MRQRRQLEYPQQIVLPLFVLLCSVYLFIYFLAQFFAVPAQLRREMTKVLLYLTTGMAVRKEFTVFY